MILGIQTIHAQTCTNTNDATSPVYLDKKNGAVSCGIPSGEFTQVTPSEPSAPTFIINASAYTAAADECGKSDGITASGKKVKEKHTLACPREYKFGTKIHIVGMGTYTCEDRGGAIKGNRFDIYMETKREAFDFGRRQLEAYVII